MCTYVDHRIVVEGVHHADAPNYTHSVAVINPGVQRARRSTRFDLGPQRQVHRRPRRLGNPGHSRADLGLQRRLQLWPCNNLPPQNWFLN
jgi:hypothetical protein